MRKTELVGLEPIQDLVELTLMTPYVKGERTVSGDWHGLHSSL
jgi:hypothetical protein